MAMVQINGVTYEFDTLSDEVKTHLKYLSYIDSEIDRLKMQLGTFHLSREQVGRMLDVALTQHTMNETPFERNEPTAPAPGVDAAT